MFRSTDYEEDNAAGVASVPATAGRFVGAAFQQQQVQGVRNVDDANDRVTYIASIDAETPQGFSIGLGGDVPSTGEQSVYGGTIFGGIVYGDPVNVDPGRPEVGFPLPHGETDEQYANRTNDYTVDLHNVTIDPLTLLDVHTIPEKPLPVLARLSGHPIEVQPERPWDTVLGAWPWLGTKVALQRPVAAAPMTFDSPLLDALPSPTGTNNADLPSQYNVTPRPLTFRLPPEPWDTSHDGQYVDSGT